MKNIKWYFEMFIEYLVTIIITLTGALLITLPICLIKGFFIELPGYLFPQPQGEEPIELTDENIT